MTLSTDTALLVIDAQESFRQRAADWAATANPAVLDNIARLVDHARDAGELVVWVTHSEPGTGGVFDPTRGFVRVVDDLDPLEGEPRITKTSINAFTTTNLHQLLMQRGVRRVVICGIRTEQCCETTARIAGDLGYDVEFVLDATTTSGIEAGAGYPALSGDEIMRRTAAVLAAREFATVVSTDERIAAVAAA